MLGGFYYLEYHHHPHAQTSRSVIGICILSSPIIKPVLFQRLFSPFPFLPYMISSSRLVRDGRTDGQRSRLLLVCLEQATMMMEALIDR